MNKDNEIKYMILDDTLDIGKEPMPTITKDDEEFFKRMKALKSEYMKKKES